MVPESGRAAPQPPEGIHHQGGPDAAAQVIGTYRQPLEVPTSPGATGDGISGEVRTFFVSRNPEAVYRGRPHGVVESAGIERPERVEGRGVQRQDRRSVTPPGAADGNRRHWGKAFEGVTQQMEALVHVEAVGEEGLELVDVQGAGDGPLMTIGAQLDDEGFDLDSRGRWPVGVGGENDGSVIVSPCRYLHRAAVEAAPVIDSHGERRWGGKVARVTALVSAEVGSGGWARYCNS